MMIDYDDNWYNSPRAQPLSGWPADLFCWQNSPFNPESSYVGITIKVWQHKKKFCFLLIWAICVKWDMSVGQLESYYTV